MRIALVVAKRAAQVGNRTSQCRLGDEPPFPHDVNNLVLRDDPSTAVGQKDKEIHDLRLEMPFGLPVADQIASGLREPTADLEVSSGGRTSLPAGHCRIVNAFVPDECPK